METSYSNLVSGFTKLFSTIIHSTVWREDMHIKVVWVTMLAMANQNGKVFASVPGLADAARVSLDQCVDALAHLSGPDEWSRTKTDEGRRIVECDGGWRLLNYQKYREMRDEDERRIQTREAVRRHRQRKAEPLTVSDVSHGKPKQKQSTEAEEEKNVRTHAANNDETVERVRRFVDLFQDLHQRYCGVAYLGNPQKDYQAACELVAAFDDSMLEKLAVFGLNDSDPFMAKGTRTLTKLKSRASDYAQQLKARHLA